MVLMQYLLNQNPYIEAYWHEPILSKWQGQIPYSFWLAPLFNNRLPFFLKNK